MQKAGSEGCASQQQIRARFLALSRISWAALAGCSTAPRPPRGTAPPPPRPPGPGVLSPARLSPCPSHPSAPSRGRRPGGGEPLAAHLGCAAGPGAGRARWDRPRPPPPSCRRPGYMSTSGLRRGEAARCLRRETGLHFRSFLLFFFLIYKKKIKKAETEALCSWRELAAG